MQELQINPVLGQIEFDFTEAKAYLEEKMSVYENLIVDEENIPQSKKDLAEIRKLRTSLEDQRKVVKQKWLEPYNAFEDEYKKLLEVIDRSVTSIDTQLKEFDVKRAEEKRKHIEEVYNAEIGELGEYLPLAKIYNPKWENKSTKDADIIYDIQEKALRVKNDLEAINALNSEIHDELLKVYKDSGNDLSKAISRNSQYLADKERVKQQAEEDARRKAEEEKRRAEAEEQLKKEQEEIARLEAEFAEKEEPAEETPAPIKQLDDFVKATKTVHFVVSEADAQQVREYLDFSQITYREE